MIKQCIHNNQVEIKTPKELVIVMETVIKLQKELDLNNTTIISSEYSREKHVKEINKLLKDLQHDTISNSEKSSDKFDDGLQNSQTISMG